MRIEIKALVDKVTKVQKFDSGFSKREHDVTKITIIKINTFPLIFLFLMCQLNIYDGQIQSGND